jgi:hypothetical protein
MKKHGGADAFVTEINAEGTLLLYSTYLGGSQGADGTGIATDTQGSAYIIGNSSSPDFPTTPGAFQESVNGESDVFVAKIASAPQDATLPNITLSATPRELWPPNGKMIPVAISGRILDLGSGVKPDSAHFCLRDEYHLIKAYGTLALDSEGKYSFKKWLRASRKGQDSNGRVYTITVSAVDNAGNRGAKLVRVTVPHSR